jgi:hypothetical protein
MINAYFWQMFSVKETRTVIELPGMTMKPEIQIFFFDNSIKKIGYYQTKSSDSFEKMFSHF